MLEEFLRATEAYQRFDPPGWVNLFRFFPMYAGVLVALLGLLMMLFGGGKLFRLIAGPLGAAVGFLWTPLLATKLGFGPQGPQIRIVATIGIGGLGLLLPAGATFFAFGIPIGLVAGDMAGNDWVIGFVPAFFIGGLVAVLAHRYIGAVASSLVGGWLLMIGLLSALHPFTRLVESVAQQPLAVLVAALLFAVAGTVYQLFVQLSPEARAAYKADKAAAKKKLAEAKKLQNRWSNYSKDKGLD